jgi:aspartate-semialdehyde dehydrogenase
MGKVVAVVGATGAVGRVMLDVLAERNFPVDRLVPLASARSAGKRVVFRGEEHTVAELTGNSFEGVDIALFSIPSTLSKVFCPAAAAAGCVAIDNSSAFRQDPETPLVVPEVNPQAIRAHKGIIANPNCSTIQLVMALKPLHDEGTVERLVITTLQAVSGAGWNEMEELRLQTQALIEGRDYPPRLFPHQIAFNVIPQIPQSDAFGANLYTSEEMKMVHETRKIMGAPDMRISATCTRVPVYRGHSESVTVETRTKITVERARELLAAAPGVTLVDDPARALYPMPAEADGKDDTFVGRVREDLSSENGLVLWIVSDNLRKGAATNAVQIAEHLIGA